MNIVRRIVIIGGGFSGSTAAVQLVRRSLEAVAITIVEPRLHPGGGLAYSSDEPDHRLNGQPRTHSLDPIDPGMFAQWCDTHKILESDPGARAPNGTLFMRRSTFRRYLEDIVAQHATWPSGSSISHKRDLGVDVLSDWPVSTVVTADGTHLQCEMVILACGHTRARLPAPFGASLAHHARIISDPLASPRLPAVPPDDRVLILGSSLTAYDAASTLLASGHRGPIDVVSRRGLRPRPQRPPPAPGEPALPPMLERTTMQPEPFIRNAGPEPTVRALLRALRHDICTHTNTGGTWDHSFDHLRDMAGQIWPTLAVSEKRRFFRQLRPWYDVHRFRVPPQNSASVDSAELRGQVRFRAATIASVSCVDADATLCVTLRPRGAASTAVYEYDRIINCTGVDAAPLHEVPLYAALLARGVVRSDASGSGLSVDPQCRAIDRKGVASANLRIIGPPTAGAHGDPLGSAFIAIQVHRVIPEILRALSAHA